MTMAKQQPLTTKQQEILQAAEAVKQLAETIIDGLREAFEVEAEEAPAAKGKATTTAKSASTKGKGKPAPEPEPEEEPEEDGEEEGLTVEDLEAMSVKELLEVAKEAEIEIPVKDRKNKDAIIAILSELIEAGDDEEEEDGGEEEGLSEEELRAMSLKEVKEVAAEMGVDIPKNIANKKDAIVDLILEASADEEESEDEEAEGEEDGEEDFEISEERLAAEEAILESVTEQVEAGELTLKAMRAYLAELYEGNAECVDCAKGKGACAKEKVIECYAMALQNFIDDEGVEHEEQDCYVRNGQYHCCGLPCDEDPDDE